MHCDYCNKHFPIKDLRTTTTGLVICKFCATILDSGAEREEPDDIYNSSEQRHLDEMGSEFKRT